MATEAEAREADAKALADKEKKAVVSELEKKPIVLVGGPGPFSIAGPGLGNKGRLTIGGVEVYTTRWDDRHVRGQIPEGMKGEILLHRDDGVVRKGDKPYER